MKRVVVPVLASLAAVIVNAQTPPDALRVLTNAPAAVPAPVVPQATVPQPATVTVPSAFTPGNPYAPPPPSEPAVSKSGFPRQPVTGRELMSQQLRHTPAPTVPAALTASVAATPVTPMTGATVAGGDTTVLWARRVPVTEPVMVGTPQADEILAGLQIFPADNPWHQRIVAWPVHANSTNIIAAIGANRPLTFNLDMPFVFVPGNQPRRVVRVTTYAAESDPGPYPLPDNTPIEGWPAWYRQTFGPSVTLDEVQRDTRKLGGDRHAIVVDPVNLMLYEFFSARRDKDGWSAEQASIFDLKTNRLRPDGWTSADAAGLPIFPAIVRYDELQRGRINHALRVTVPRSAMAYVAPATHYASRDADPNLPRMGERLRLRAGFNTMAFAPEARTILDALKEYGMFVADNGSIFAISVAPDERMPATLRQLSNVKCSDFEVVTAP